MFADEPIAVTGATGSPYTRKMLAVLRYRRIPYRFLPHTSPELQHLPQPKRHFSPTFFLPGTNGELEAMVDSSPIIRRLERDLSARSLIPSDPVLAFLDELIEDYADEWLNKPMYHYRWAYSHDLDQEARLHPIWQELAVSDEEMAARAKPFFERQIGRLWVVGSNAIAGPVIEASYRRFLQAFEEHLKAHPFLLGERPGASDFAVFGQLSQLAHFDATSMAETLKIAPRVFDWVTLVDDQSGLEPKADDWIESDAIPPTLVVLLKEIGRVYTPFMLANAAALAAGAPSIQTEIDGQPWSQPPVGYQAKCLQWLRASRGALAAPDRARVDTVLAGTGCEALFE